MKRNKKPKKIIKLPKGYEDLKKGTPTEEGFYLVYFDPETLDGWSSVKTKAGIGLSFWNGKRWMFNHPILAFTGPLNVLNLDKLRKGEITAQAFFTGSLNQIINKEYETGPFYHFFSAFCNKARKSHFIFCFDSTCRYPYPVAKAKPVDEEFKWKNLNKTSINKYKKVIKAKNENKFKNRS